LSPVDPRLTLIRNGVAAARLEGLVPADRYVQTHSLQTILPVAGIRRAPERASEQVDQLLFGERFEVLERANGWAFGQADRDGYVGWVRLEGFQPSARAPTHWVRALRTYAFTKPSIKAAPRGRYSMNALVEVQEEDGRFRRIAGSGWIVAEHLASLGEWERDPASAALQYVGAPYLWGGRDSLGLDCSGLVQQALYACGRACPRDSDQQQALGEPQEPGPAYANLRRSDLVFWRGHVGMMIDGQTLLHANAHQMAAAIEPLAEAIARIRAAGSGEPIAFRRLPWAPVLQTGWPEGDDEAGQPVSEGYRRAGALLNALRTLRRTADRAPA
jgi:cell wall-associated NlpC family hydrolase